MNDAHVTIRNLTYRRYLWSVCTVAGAALLYVGWSAYWLVEEKPLLRAHSSLMTLLVAGDFEQAYRLTTNEYRVHHTAEEFQSTFGDVKGNSYYLARSPTVISLCLYSAEVYADENSGFFELLNGLSFFYRKEQGQWRFTGETVQYLD